MRIIIIPLVLISAAAFAKAQSGYTYVLNVTRSSTTAPNNDVAEQEAVTSREQPLEYKKTVNADHPLLLSGDVKCGNSDIIYEIKNRNAISSCAQYEEGTWDNVIVKITNAQLMPSGSCPVEPGTYTIYQILVVEVTFEEMLRCGDYRIRLYINNEDRRQRISQMTWEFVLPDDGSCVPQESS